LKLRPEQMAERVTADAFWFSFQLTVPMLFEAVDIVCAEKLFPTMPDTVAGAVIAKAG